jgi:hypothetical protein
MDEFDIDSDSEDIMVVAVTADPDTWLPRVLLGIPVDDDYDSEIDGIIPVSLTPEEAYQVGAYLIQAASTVSSFYTELIDKTIDERKEIISLESQFMDSPYPF